MTAIGLSAFTMAPVISLDTKFCGLAVINPVKRACA